MIAAVSHLSQYHHPGSGVVERSITQGNRPIAIVDAGLHGINVLHIGTVGAAIGIVICVVLRIKTEIPQARLAGLKQGQAQVLGKHRIHFS